MVTRTIDELKEMAEEYCKLKEVERKVKPRLDVLKDIFEKNLKPGEAIQCSLGTVQMTKQGKTGFAFLTKDGEVEMATFKKVLCDKGWASFKAGNPYIECKLTKVVE